MHSNKITLYVCFSVTAIVEAGLIEMWRKRWWPKSAPCPSFLKAEARQIMLADIQSSFYILLGGISLAGFVLSAEMSCVKWKLLSGKRKKDSQRAASPRSASFPD